MHEKVPLTNIFELLQLLSMLITNCSGRAKTKQSANDNTTFLLTYNDLMYFFLTLPID